MLRKYKYRGFTLFELIIAMTITSILIIVFMIAYNILLSATNKYKNDLISYSQLQQVEKIFTYDIDISDLILLDEEKVFCIKEDTIIYGLLDSALMRNNDTLYYGEELKFLFNFEEKEKDKGIIDEVNINIENLGIQLVYHKKYSPNVLMNIYSSEEQ
jgi:prepilin-type N-terminal cleavage/methylation domain-containing protein